MSAPVESLTPAEARQMFRDGLSVPTSGWCTGMTQANLIAVPKRYAYDFLLFAQRNPQSCPVIDVSDPGSPRTSLAPGADLRTDIPGYRIIADGVVVEERSEVTEQWTDDMVAFLIGCSFTFEHALVDAGVPVRHLTAGRNVPMYRTNVASRAAGVMHGPIVVSMRAIPARQVATAVQVTSRYPTMHGAPLHIGDPASLGIADLDSPDYGDAPLIEDGDVPVFWGCGVTPQAIAVAAGLPFAIAHAPGKMMITDVADTFWAV
ncbi:putative hydro-lyase [Nocardioides sp.]|uniref:putative hydro-lyase n=1 Tax=Nocardioides sp. TaxID=35761 RepID=UPI0026168DCA|nr:putative hydro-lyase [Nocardioides sp.]MCW2737341.1 hypothetical protein [Nocardioides sp.]